MKAGLLLAAAALTYAQAPLPTQIGGTKFARGQNVVPVYEGWLRNADGSATFVFGYFNRNWEEELVIPAGPDNKLEPGDVDRGQPTFFAPRRQGWIFRVRVPADWGNKELVWTITSAGKTEKAYAALIPEYEITERMIMTRGNLSPGTDDPNRPPTVTIAPPSPSAGVALALTATVSDDGLPKPRVVVVPAPGTAPAQTNTVAARPRGLTVSWLQYRGPAKVSIDPAGPIPVSGGPVVTRATFPQPGIYVLRATANDGTLSTVSEVSLTVR